MADPAYAAKARARGRQICAVMNSDPAIIAKRNVIQKARMRELYQDPAYRARKGCLPPMTPDERRLYKKLTRNGAARADALRVMGKAQ
nr:hypothetical protein [uncultured Dongia sp.]